MKKKALVPLLSLLPYFYPSGWAQDAVERVQPTPQKARIDALISRLELRGLGHQIKTLEADSDRFVGLFNDSRTSSTQGCLLLLPADNEHPDWPDIISPIRNTLPDYSWCTLSIELPDATPRGEAQSASLSNETQNKADLANQERIFLRIQSAINFMAEQQVSNLALLGSKTGAAYALSFLSSAPSNIKSLVLVDSDTPSGVNRYELAQTIKQINLPIIDIYSEANQTKNSQFAQWRQQAAQQRQGGNWQYITVSAEQEKSLTGDNQELVQRVRGFLKQNTSQIGQRKRLPEVSKGLFY